MSDGPFPQPSSSSPRYAAWCLPLVAAAGSVWLGRDVNWDLLNYHYYNVFAWLHDRHTLDLAVAQLQSWFNPLLHLPLYAGMQHLPPRVYAALLGAVQGLNLVLVWSLARTAWPSSHVLVRSGPLLVALTAGTGAAFVTQLGTSFGDTLVSLPVLGAVLLIARARHSDPRMAILVLAAGVLAGIAIGLKPLAGIYALALAAATAALPGTFRQRVTSLAVLAAGTLIGIAASAGWWYWHVWQVTGNPLFPYYNDLFQSPLYWRERFVFSFFLPKTWTETLFYPWIWLTNPARVSEIRFIHLSIPVLMTMMVATSAARLFGWRGIKSDGATPARVLFVFWLVAYALWLTQSSVYRFAAVIEMLAPLLVVVLIAAWVPTRVMGRAIVLGLAPLLLVTYPANFGRFPFPERYMAMDAIPLLPDTMVLVAGWAPLSYVVPAFPANTPVVRIQSNMHGFVDRPHALDTEARRRVEQHTGPLRLLLAQPEWYLAQPVLDHYGYRVDRETCDVVNGWLHGGGGMGLLHLCPLTRD